jgi:topoisomerase-4 subunit A
MDFVSGPDFPTGGVVVDSAEAIAGAYATGRGGFRVRARWEIEKGAQGSWSAVVTEIPYQVPKSKLIEQIAGLISDKRLPILTDIRDESDENIRIVLEPRSRTVEPQVLMDSLFRLTDLEVRISLNLNVLDANRTPRVMSLREVLTEWLDHQIIVLVRRSEHRVAKIVDRVELLEGYLIAYLNLDRVIEIIRTEDEPKPVMIAEFALTDRQAEAILNMRLRSLRKLEEMQIRKERDALEKEREELARLIESLAGKLWSSKSTSSTCVCWNASWKSRRRRKIRRRMGQNWRAGNPCGTKRSWNRLQESEPGPHWRSFMSQRVDWRGRC